MRIRGIFACISFFLLSVFAAAGESIFAQAREDYIITHQPSVNIRPCPRFAEECNALYRLPAGYIIADGIVVSGDWYGTSDQWIRFWRDGQFVYIHSGLVAEHCKIDLSGSIDNRITQFERWAKCKFTFESWMLERMDEEQFEEVWWFFVEDACGKDTSIYFWFINEDWECKREFWGNVDNSTSNCSPVELTGTFRNRLLEFERWLDCEHDIDGFTFLELLDKGVNQAIWWQFIEVACGPFTPEYNWEINVDFECEQVLWRTEETNPSSCRPVQLIGNLNERRSVFEGWLMCEYDMDMNTYRYFLSEDRQVLIWYEFILLACGEETDTHFWALEDWQCVQLPIENDGGARSA